MKASAVRRFRSYTPTQLCGKLTELGLRTGDTVCMHSSFDMLNGFAGHPGQVIDCVLDVIGPEGTLVMMSMPYTGLARDYLVEGEPFDVRRTISRMGLITEVFRRRRGVLRSLNPVHPVLAYGRRAGEFVAGHEHLLHSCGPGSPFAKLYEWRAKILFFGARFQTCTFLHHLEDRFQEDLPVRVYPEEPLQARVIDAEGTARQITTFVLDPGSTRYRNTLWLPLERDLRRRGNLVVDRIGNTRLILVGAPDLVDGAARLLRGADAGARS